MFLAWCQMNQRGPMPASPQTMALFIDMLGKTKALTTVQRYLSSITTMHRIAGWKDPVATPLVRGALKRLRRSKSLTPVLVIPLTRRLIERMLAATPETVIGLRNKALLSVAYDTLARPMEMSALRIEDVGPGGATVQIRPLSAEQPHLRQSAALTEQTIRHLRAWQTLAPHRTGPLFPRVTRTTYAAKGLKGLSITLIFRAMATAAGLPTADIARISGLSSRVGAVQDMANQGCSIPVMMQAGGWKVPGMVIRYIALLKKNP